MPSVSCDSSPSRGPETKKQDTLGLERGSRRPPQFSDRLELYRALFLIVGEPSTIGLPRLESFCVASPSSLVLFFIPPSLDSVLRRAPVGLREAPVRPTISELPVRDLLFQDDAAGFWALPGRLRLGSIAHHPLEDFSFVFFRVTWPLFPFSRCSFFSEKFPENRPT